MQKRLKEKFLPSAANDFEEILNYIAEKLKNPQAALKLIDEIEEIIENLCMFPESGSPHENSRLAAKGIRKMPVKNYIIHYVIDQNKQRLCIIAIKYSGSDQNEINTDF